MKTKSIDDLLQAILLEGEGRGRLSIENNQYVFSYDAILKENNDWLLAVTIPLHGEEVMVLPDLKKSDSPDSTEAFQKRIQSELPAEINKQFIEELRSLVRFMLAQKLELNRECSESKSLVYKCVLENKSYEVVITDQIIRVKKVFSDYFLEVAGENLTDSFFGKSTISLHSDKGQTKPSPILNLELFWK